MSSDFTTIIAAILAAAFIIFLFRSPLFRWTLVLVIGASLFYWADTQTQGGHVLQRMGWVQP